MTPRHPKSKRPIHSPEVCVDDFGNSVVRCHYTGKLVHVGDPTAQYIGPVTPQAPGTYLCAADAREAFKKSRALFDESEANCNTCTHLQRIPHGKQHPSAPMRGVCGANGAALVFHPDDFMGMSCWEGRA
jgi:hypothetical protein